MTIDKFDPNLVLINIIKLKPYRFVEDHTLQLVIVKPRDLLLEELIEINHYNDVFTKEPTKMVYFLTFS